MKRQAFTEISEKQLDTISGGVIFTVGIFTPKFNVSVVYIFGAVIDEPLTITVKRGVHRL